MKLTEIKPGEMYERDWDKSTDVVDLSPGARSNELYVMLWRDTHVHDNWMGVWVVDRSMIVEFDDWPAPGAEFRLVMEMP